MSPASPSSRSPSVTATVTALAAAFIATADSAYGSMSLPVTSAAPALAAAMATRPEPDARSSTRRPATTCGWSRTYRARAWPPAQAFAQNGVRPGPACASILARNTTASSARCRRISGTNAKRTRRSPSKPSAWDATKGASRAPVGVGKTCSVPGQSPGQREATGCTDADAPDRQLAVGTRSAMGSDGADVRGLRTLRALGDVELDPLVLLQATEAAGADRREVGEHVRATTIRGDEPETLIRVEPLHRTGRHVFSLKAGFGSAPCGPDIVVLDARIRR